MTREEAIKALRTESVEIGGNAVSVARWLTALDVAVKALEDVTDKDVGKMTNAQKIRSMPDEELAECLFQIGYDNGWSRKEYAIEWLQRPSGEEDKHEAV